jgi:hypothetical protein
VSYRCLSDAEKAVKDSRTFAAVSYRCLSDAETAVRDSRITGW